MMLHPKYQKKIIDSYWESMEMVWKSMFFLMVNFHIVGKNNNKPCLFEKIPNF
jgi:hypothetical protein